MAQLPYAQLKPFIELMRYEWGYSAKMLYVSKLMKTVQGEAESRIRARDRANLYVGCERKITVPCQIQWILKAAALCQVEFVTIRVSRRP
jgi:hypothetical protein